MGASPLIFSLFYYTSRMGIGQSRYALFRPVPKETIMQKKAFTLTELLVVVVIIGVSGGSIDNY